MREKREIDGAVLVCCFFPSVREKIGCFKKTPIFFLKFVFLRMSLFFLFFFAPTHPIPP